MARVPVIVLVGWPAPLCWGAGPASQEHFEQVKSSRKDKAMSVTLVGKVNYNRVMTGTYDKGKRQGQQWEFLSLDILDPATGFVWSCQFDSSEPKYQEYADDSLKGHKVRVRISSQTAGQRTMPDGSTRMQIRSRLVALEDLGEWPEDD